MPITSPLEELTGHFLKALTPPPDLTLSEWADAYFYLSAESSANAGKWHTLPYQKDILDAFTDPEIEEVWVKKSARLGFTKILDIVCGYHIHYDPCPIMFVQPTIEYAQGTSKEEIDPMLRDVPVLAAIAPKTQAKTKDETILHKLFKGPMGRASLSLVGANLLADSAGCRGVWCFLTKWTATRCQLATKGARSPYPLYSEMTKIPDHSRR